MARDVVGHDVCYFICGVRLDVSEEAAEEATSVEVAW